MQYTMKICKHYVVWQTQLPNNEMVSLF